MTEKPDTAAAGAAERTRGLRSRLFLLVNSGVLPKVVRDVVEPVLSHVLGDLELLADECVRLSRECAELRVGLELRTSRLDELERTVGPLQLAVQHLEGSIARLEAPPARELGPHDEPENAVGLCTCNRWLLAPGVCGLCQRPPQDCTCAPWDGEELET